MSKIIGIDFGTSTSEVALLEEGNPVVIPNLLGEVITPSVVGISESNSMLVGKDARDQLLLRPEDTVIEVKRLMGSKERVSMGEKEYTPPEIASYILKHLKESAQSYLGEEITRAVITVPAYFTDEQRRATVEAGKLAGLKVERIINEPTAAALAYGVNHMEKNQHVLVYDLGGGTLDVTVLEMFQGVLEVKASSGNNQLGGKDFDQQLMDYLLKSFKERQALDISQDKRAMARIKEAAEICKIALSSEKEHRVILPFIASKDNNPVALEQTITQETMEALIAKLIESTMKPIEIALGDANLNKEDLDIVLMVGGSTRIPLVRRFLSEKLAQEPQSPVDPDLAVVMGAALQAGIINQELSAEKDILITDVCPYTLGVKTLGFFGSVPTEDLYSVVIPRNTTIPAVREEIYATVADNQEKVEIVVYQGDYRKASLNNLLGNFILDGVPPAPACKEKIKIQFAYDINGILQVEGTILSTKKQARITIETTGVGIEQEVNLEKWSKAPGAKRYRGILRRAEKILRQEPKFIFQQEIDALVKDFKKALIQQQDKGKLEELEETLTDMIYSLEDNK